MRVLLAIDALPHSRAAVDLMTSLRWPQGTVIDVIGVEEPKVDVFGHGLYGTTTTPYPVADPKTTLAAALDEAAAALESPTCLVRRAILVGEPSAVIVQAADTFRADLIVVGSRGLGSVKTALVGSVSAAVVDHAPCPVLVVRGGAIGSVLLAVDASTAAQTAVTYLEANRFLAGLPFEVLTVTEPSAQPAMLPLASMSPDSIEWYDTEARDRREEAAQIATSSAIALRRDGYSTRSLISQGDAAHEILRVAGTLDRPLVVVGTRGYHGLTRLVLGSVARRVLLHAHGSVLVVREPIRQRDKREVPAREPVMLSA